MLQRKKIQTPIADRWQYNKHIHLPAALIGTHELIGNLETKAFNGCCDELDNFKAKVSSRSPKTVKLLFFSSFFWQLQFIQFPLMLIIF